MMFGCILFGIFIAMLEGRRLPWGYLDPTNPLLTGLYWDPAVRYHRLEASQKQALMTGVKSLDLARIEETLGEDRQYQDNALYEVLNQCLGQFTRQAIREEGRLLLQIVVRLAERGANLAFMGCPDFHHRYTDNISVMLKHLALGGDEALVKQVEAFGFPLDQWYAPDIFWVHHLAAHGSPSMLRSYLAAHPEAVSILSCQVSPIEAAMGRLDNVAVLVEAGADLQALLKHPRFPQVFTAKPDHWLEYLRGRVPLAQRLAGGNTLLHLVSMLPEGLRHFQRLVPQGAPLDVKNDQGQLPVQLALAHFSSPSALIDFMMEARMDNYDPSELLCLYAGQKSVRAETVFSLVRFGAKLTKRSGPAFLSQLMRLTQTDLPSTAYPQLVCMTDADILGGEHRSDDSTFLHWLAQYGPLEGLEYAFVELVKLRGEAGLEQTNNLGQTPLMHLLERCLEPERALESLLSKTAFKSDTNNETILHYLARNPHLKSLQALYALPDFWGFLDMQSHADGSTVMHILASNNTSSMGIFCELAGYGADSNFRRFSDGVTPLMLAIQRNWDLASLIESAIQAPHFDPEAKDNVGRGYIEYVIARSDCEAEILTRLIQRGAPLDQPTLFKILTALPHPAALVSFLVEADPAFNLNAQDPHGCSLFFMAVNRTTPPLSALLTWIKAGADLFLPNRDGVSPLMLILRGIREPDALLKALQALLEDKLQAQDGYGRSALHYLGANRHAGPDAFNFLADLGANSELPDYYSLEPIDYFYQCHPSPKQSEPTFLDQEGTK